VVKSGLIILNSAFPTRFSLVSDTTECISRFLVILPMKIKKVRQQGMQGGIMSVTSIGLSKNLSGSDLINSGNLQKNNKSASISSNNYAVSARAVTENFSSTKFSFDYTSKDGDMVSFSMESLEYNKSLLEVSATGSQEDMKELVDRIKDNLDKMEKSFLKSFLNDNGVDVLDTQTAEEATSVEIPEYWNAQNTSQRIVDFAVSFYQSFKGSGEDFLSTVTNAIDEGFKQAREMLGDLPEEFNNLINDTYALVNEKLSSWAAEKNIAVAAAESPSL
jgi:hypothetical protein